MYVAGLLLRSALCALLAMGCTSGGPTGNDTPTPPQELPDGYAENRGQSLPILEISTNSAIRWEDPAEIVFNTVGSGVVQRITAIRTLRLSDLSARTLHTGGNVNYLGYRGIEVSPDGRQIYSVLSKPVTGPDSPTVLTIKVLFAQPGLPIAEQGSRGRAQMLGTSFAQYERAFREQLGDMFAPGGFDPRRDIAGIILNRWGHAYVNPQPGFFFGVNGKPAPRDILRNRTHGRIAFANTDLAGAMDHRNSIREADRAVKQLLGD